MAAVIADTKTRLARRLLTGPRMRTLGLALLLCACEQPRVVTVSGDVSAASDALDFGRTALNFSRQRAVVLRNRGLASQTLPVSAQPPFSAPGSVTVPAGGDANLEVTFTPTTVGVVRSLLQVGELAVVLVGEGDVALECQAATCHQATFDPETLSCVDAVLADGTACSDRCVEGSCSAGACVGVTVSCDDQNACTVDSCRADVGCEHSAPSSDACPAPTEPCRAAVCDPVTGCSAVPVADGTPCGPATCDEVGVCLSGACQTRVPPDGFVCEPPSPCQGEGRCEARQCVRHDAPVPVAARRYTVPDLRSKLRFDGVSDALGNWYWLECFTEATRRQGSPDEGAAFQKPTPNERCEVVSTTDVGTLRYRRLLTTEGWHGEALAGTQVITEGLYVFGVNGTFVAAVDTTTGAVRWTRELHPLSTTDSVTMKLHALAADDAGTVWVAIRSNELKKDSLVALDARTGAIRTTRVIDGAFLGLVIDSSGTVFTTRTNINVPFDTRPATIPPNVVPSYWLEAHTVGAVLFSRSITESQPVAAVGTHVVMDTDDVRDGSTGALQVSATGHQVNRWAPVATNATRLRVTKSPFASNPFMGLAWNSWTLPPPLPVFDKPWATASSPFLTRSGDAFVVGRPATSDVMLLSTPTGRVRFECPLLSADQRPRDLLELSRVGFNGNTVVLAAQPCAVDSCSSSQQLTELWFYPTTALGFSASGWVAPRGTPQAVRHSR